MADNIRINTAAYGKDAALAYADVSTTESEGVHTFHVVADSVDSAVSGITEYNITLTNANTEYPCVLPETTRAIAFRCRTSVEVRYAWANGKVAGASTPYQTLKAGAEYWKDVIKLTSKVVYFASGTAGVVIELEAWS